MSKEGKEIIECDICGKVLSEEQLAWEERVNLNDCNCNEFIDMNKDIVKAKKRGFQEGKAEAKQDEIKFLEQIQIKGDWNIEDVNNIISLVDKRLQELKG